MVEIGIIAKAFSATNIPMIAVIKDRHGKAKNVRFVMNLLELKNSFLKGIFRNKKANII